MKVFFLVIFFFLCTVCFSQDLYILINGSNSLYYPKGELSREFISPDQMRISLSTGLKNFIDNNQLSTFEDSLGIMMVSTSLKISSKSIIEPSFFKANKLNFPVNYQNFEENFCIPGSDSFKQIESINLFEKDPDENKFKEVQIPFKLNQTPNNFIFTFRKCLLSSKISNYNNIRILYFGNPEVISDIQVEPKIIPPQLETELFTNDGTPADVYFSGILSSFNRYNTPFKNFVNNFTFKQQHLTVPHSAHMPISLITIQPKFLFSIANIAPMELCRRVDIDGNLYYGFQSSMGFKVDDFLQLPNSFGMQLEKVVAFPKSISIPFQVIISPQNNSSNQQLNRQNPEWIYPSDLFYSIKDSLIKMGKKSPFSFSCRLRSSFKLSGLPSGLPNSFELDTVVQVVKKPPAMISGILEFGYKDTLSDSDFIKYADGKELSEFEVADKINFRNRILFWILFVGLVGLLLTGLFYFIYN